MDKIDVYAAVQNGVILDTYDTIQGAMERVQEEKKNDWLTIMFTKKLRKLFKRSGNVPLHRYAVLHVVEVEEVK